MAGPRLLDTEIPTKTHNRAGQVGMLRLGARPGARHREPPYAGMPARAPAAAVVWWWRWRGGSRCTRAGGGGTGGGRCGMRAGCGGSARR